MRDTISLNRQELPTWVEPVSDPYCGYRQQGKYLQKATAAEHFGVMRNSGVLRKLSALWSQLNPDAHD